MEEIRAPDTKELAHKDYQKGVKYKDIASKYDVSLNTIKSWKTRYKWTKKGVHTKEKKGAPAGNKNAVDSGAPNQNKNAEKHGIFTKYMPEETLDIINSVEVMKPIDIIWHNITIQYAAIIRAQKIMYVKDIEDKTTTKISESNGDTSYSEKWEIQQAWDKQASFLQAQSRAMVTLNGLIKQYDEMLHKDWGIVTEEQKARIDLLKGKIGQITGEGIETEDTTEIDSDIYG